MATKIKKFFSALSPKNEEKSNTDWKSIYIATFVTFLSSIQSYTVNPTLWPYIKFINPGITETANGAFQGASALGNAIASTIAGILVNKFSTTKPPLIAAKVLTIFAAFFYFGIEINFNAAVVLLIIFQALCGIAGGMGSVYRTHISMATAESERAKAFGLAMFATAIGSIIGPLSQMLFSLIKYPGLSLFFGIHFNMFTAPVFLTFITSIIGGLMLLFFFNGNLHIPTKEEKKKQIEEHEDIKMTNYQRLGSTSDTTSDVVEEIVETVKYDKVAVIILIITKVTQDINILVLLSIAMPYSMAVFEWSSKDMILYQSILMAPMGIFSLAFSFIYIRFNLVKKIPERLALITGLVIFFLFYFLTFPWWFLSSTIPYAHEIGAPVYYSQQEATAALAALNQTGELVGCNVAYNWCETTKKINFIVFAIVAIASLGFGMPLSHINLDILYSKVLGPIKQGVWQGVLQASGQIINIVGPILVTLVYTVSGPFWLWLFELIVTGICIALLAIFYPRLISYTVRLEKELEKRKLKKIVV